MLPRRKLPPLNALRAFEVAGRRLNFRIAAEELGVSQGAVAQQVRALEDHLGQPLFHRLSRGLALTVQGKAYLADISHAFDTLGTATDRLALGPERVTISVSPTVATRLLIPGMAALTQSLHGVELRTIADESLPDFSGDDVDIAIGPGRPPFPAGVEALLLIPQDIIAVISPKLLSGDPPIKDADILSLPLVHHCFDNWPKFLNVKEPLPGPRFSLTTLAIDAALAGQGAIAAPRAFVADELADGRLVQLSERSLRVEPGYYIVRSGRAPRRAAASAVWDWCVETFMAR